MPRVTRISRPSWIVRGAAIAGAALACLPALVHGQELEQRIRSALSQARLGTAKVGVSVYDVQRKAEVVDIQAGNRTYIPASNLKLLTSGAALAVLGPDFEFRTALILDGDRLVVRGSGDPGLADPDLLSRMGTDLNSLLDRLIEMSRQSGLSEGSRIREVVLDDRVFDRESVHPDWPRDQLHLSYCAPVSGLNFHANLFNAYVEPPRSQPEAPWIVVKRQLRKVKEGQNELRLDREKDSPYTFKLSGNLRYPPDGPLQVTVDKACLMLGRLLADRLIRDGLAAPGLTSDTMPVRFVGADERIGEDPSCRTLAVVRTPIAVVLERCNVDSDNLYAESLMKAMGHRSTGQPGSWANGGSVVRMQLKERLGSELAAQLIIADGSGLSRNNRVTPQMITRWLADLASDPRLGTAFVTSLPMSGEGTLRKRFKGSKLRCEVRGKSGYIREVRALSGYVTEPASGRRMAYSVIINEIPPGADARSKEFHETVVELIDAHLAAAAGLDSAKKKNLEPRERIGG